MGEKKVRIAIFLDYENVSFALKGDDQNFPRPADIIRPLVEEFAVEGDLVFRYAYADWSKFPQDTVILVEGLGFTPIYGLTRAKYDHGTIETNVHMAVPVGLALDALNLLHTNKSVDAFIFVTGDGEYYEIIDRIRQNDVDVLLCAFERSVSTEITEFNGIHVAMLENIIGPPKSAGPARERKIEWAPFIRLLLSLELRYGYVGYRGLKDKLDGNVGCGTSETDKRRFMDMATQQEVITLEKMQNPKNPDFPLTVCRLNRKNPIVQSILRNSLGFGNH